MPMQDMLHENRVTIKDAIRPVAQQIADTNGLSFKVLKGAFNRGQFKMVLQFGVPAIEAEMHQEFIARYLPIVGLPDDIIGQVYEKEGQSYTVVDLSEKLGTTCMRCVHTGTTTPRYKVAPATIRTALGLPDPHDISDLNPDDEDDN